MAHRFSFNNYYPKSYTYNAIYYGHKTYLLHLASTVKLEDRTHFNIHILKQGYNYNAEEIIDFWIKTNLLY